jgi:2-polyprenyl-6-methoxyphenol hydroxylase-like FAD-dependent oxidoreductase
METEVLVVGAGPTGLTLAAELCRRDVDCRLIDARSEVQHWDRATVVHPRSLELFESLGIVDRFLEAGVPQRSARLYSEGQVVAELDFSASGAPYPYNLGLSEEMTESFLGDYLREQGGSVERGMRLVGFEDDGGSVRATLERDGARTELSAKWVVGCDGYHSVTREQAGIELQGHDIADPWAVFDVTLAGRGEDFETTIVYLEETMVILTPLPGRRFRIYTRPTSEEADFVAEAAATIALYEPGATLVDVENPDRFRCHSKVADRYRSGRVLLAGDAAHVCSPSQGHGMNCGIQDAANLAWKLALACKGAATPDLLDSYGVERRPVALGIADTGEAMEVMGRFDGAEARARRDAELRASFVDPETIHSEAVAEAELNIDYAGSPIVAGESGGPVPAGERLPDVGPVQLPGEEPRRLHELTHRPGHTLLALARQGHGEELPRLLAELEEIAAGSPLFEAAFAFAAEPGAPAPVGTVDPAAAAELGVAGITLLAVRPDRHLGFRSDRGDVAELQGYAALVASAVLR